jgi:hypothetical protein
MSSRVLTIVAVFAVAYIVGAKWPVLAQKVGVA